MRDRNLIAAGADLVIAAVCCAAPVVFTAASAGGLFAWLAKVGNARNQAPKLRVNSGKATDWYTARRVGESI
ncbi:MAG: hypothetical protein ACREDM_15525 [Methylocella sp.]